MLFIGGGFGGKSRKPMLSGVPAAVAANKLVTYYIIDLL